MRKYIIFYTGTTHPFLGAQNKKKNKTKKSNNNYNNDNDSNNDFDYDHDNPRFQQDGYN